MAAEACNGCATPARLSGSHRVAPPLQPAHAEAFVNGPARLALAGGILFVAAGSLMTHGGVTASRLTRPHGVALAASDATQLPRHSIPNDDGAAVDLYGNEVTDAIATYTLDSGGSLYELHSPQTELPRLGEPKS
jgi:hypothetical protein